MILEIIARTGICRCDVLLMAALTSDGDVKAIREILDRVEGKVLAARADSGSGVEPIIIRFSGDMQRVL